MPRVTRVARKEGGFEPTVRDSKTSALSSSQTLVWTFASETEIVATPSPPSGKRTFQKPVEREESWEDQAFYREKGFSAPSPPPSGRDWFLEAGRVDREGPDYTARPLGH